MTLELGRSPMLIAICGSNVQVFENSFIEHEEHPMSRFKMGVTGWTSMSERFMASALFVLMCVICVSAAQPRPPKLFSDLPAVAQSRISAALGSDIPGYEVRVSPSGFRVTNAVHKLNADFVPEGMEIQTGAEHWRMALRSYGYGNDLQAVPSATPQAVSNRVEYRRGTFTEWYVNGPAGIEQGFTFAQRPNKTNLGPLTIALALSGDLIAGLEKDGRGQTLIARDPAGTALLRYSGLTAYDAANRELPVWLQLQGSQVMLRVDDRGAIYPVVVDPFVQHAELTASDGASGDSFGASVAISGSTVVIGAPNAKVGSNFNQGAAYVFVKPTTGWANMTQTAKLTSSNGSGNDNFGTSVAISGSTIVVGAPKAFIGFVEAGTAYVFVKPMTGWTNATETARLTPFDGAPEAFGQAVAISGSTVMVGAPSATINGNTFQGAVYVFNKPGTGWKNLSGQTKLTASDGKSNSQLGKSVAFSGTTVVAGAPFATVNSNTSQGETYVFLKPATGGWKSGTEAAQLTASDGQGGDEFGKSVALITGTSPTVVVGAPCEADCSKTGYAYVYVKPTSGWTTTNNFTAKLTSSNSLPSDNFGMSVAIVGKTIAVGADRECCTNLAGSVYIYTKPTTGWATTSTPAQELHPNDSASSDKFGVSVALAGSLVAGASGHSSGSGSGYVF
jgi:trimeric autotransporter adhesin